MNRTEKDALGTLEVPAGAYYGIFTERAKRNFQISGMAAPPAFIRALATTKKCAAAANRKIGVLEPGISDAIIRAASEIISGRHTEQFPLDIYQAGAGTPYNMNMNEVIANLAIEKLGGAKGQYSIVHPNNHVNLAQSSNDAIPTAARLAALAALQQLKKELKLTAGAFARKADEHAATMKTGRTHLQDAVPMTYKQQFSSYSTSVSKSLTRIEQAEKELQELGIGGTAIGTGITAHPEFKEAIIAELRKETGMDLRIAEDTMETTWSHAALLAASSSIRALAVELAKICDDLILLSSGPNSGIAEITLPEVEPGSSIMPGKINPSIPECMRMICYQAIGNDTAIMEACRTGNLELNVNTPLIITNLLDSIRIMGNGLKMMRELCIEGLKVNAERSEKLLEGTLIYGTALNPYLGYEAVAEIVKEALQTGKTIRQLVIEHKLMGENTLNTLLDTKNMTTPQPTDLELARKTRESAAYRDYRRKIGK